MNQRVLIASWLLLFTALGDTSAPGRLNFAGHVIDPGAAKVLQKPSGAARCPDDSGFPSRIAWRENQRLHGPDQTQIVQLTARHALFASFWRSHPAGAIVEAATGRRIRLIDDEPAALIEDARGEVMGLIVVDAKAEEVRRLDPTGKLRWRTRVKGLRGDRARALVDGARLYLAPFDAISTGAQLYAFDWASGAWLWKGEVREIMAAHSEYLHDLRLSLAGGNVMLEGVESAGCTLQLFEPASGIRKLELTLTPGGWGR